MIRLSVEKYCENCSEFSPAVITEGEQYIGRAPVYDMSVVCEHAGRCRAMMEELKRRDAK